MILPQDFVSEMRDLLGDEFPKFLKIYEDAPFRGVRVNLLKCEIEKFKKIFPHNLRSTPFSPETFYIDSKIQGLGNLPLHHSGAFYAQEPSATTAVRALSPKPGEKILDLCAAPGGKSTQIAACMKGEGLLWSNEIVFSRAKILLSNIERMGVKNAVVSSCHPKLLAERLANFFDKILVDAPCSGEGMFRKDRAAVEHWSRAHVSACAARQGEILHTAAKMLKAGGVMVYSTCTFSRAENEQVIDNFLKTHTNFVLEEIAGDFGRAGYSRECTADMRHTRRIFPMDGGEGHFVAKLRCTGKQLKDVEHTLNPKAAKSAHKTDANISQFLDAIYSKAPKGRICDFGSKLMLLPEGLPDISGLGILRAGLLLGEYKKGRIEPNHALFMAAASAELRQVVDLPADSPEAHLFLSGQEIAVPESLSGFVGVCVNSITTGFGKCSDGTLKNKYPKGLRAK